MQLLSLAQDMHTWLRHRNLKTISPVGGSVHVGGSGNYANLISSPSSGNLAAYLDAQRSLPTLGEAEDLLVRAVFVIKTFAILLLQFISCCQGWACLAADESYAFSFLAASPSSPSVGMSEIGV